MNNCIYDGNVLAFGAKGRDCLPQSVGVGDGKICSLRESFSDGNRHSNESLTMMPSFIDPHGHFTAVAQASLPSVELSGLQTLDDISKAVSDYIKAERPKPGEWITARNFDLSGIYPKNNSPRLMPTREALDRISTDYPLVLAHSSGHSGVFNSTAARAVGDGFSGGFAAETEYIEMMKKVPPPAVEKWESAFATAERLYLSNGITTVCEGMAVRGMIPLLRSGITKHLDVVLCCPPSDYPAFESSFPYAVGKYVQNIKIGALKIFLDGSPQAGTAFMREPYSDGSGGMGFGESVMSPGEIYDALLFAAHKRLPLHAHANGDGAVKLFLNAAARAVNDGIDIKSMRCTLIHAQFIGTDQLALAASLGIIVSFFVGHIKYFGDEHIRRFGYARASKISPVGSALRNNIPFTLHTDSPVTPPNLLSAAECAVRRITGGGTPLDPSERVGIYDALCGITVNAAYAYFEEKQKGTVEVGKRADLVILSENPLSVEADKLSEIKVESVCKDGVEVFCRDNKFSMSY